MEPKTKYGVDDRQAGSLDVTPRRADVLFLSLHSRSHRDTHWLSVGYSPHVFEKSRWIGQGRSTC